MLFAPLGEIDETELKATIPLFIELLRTRGGSILSAPLNQTEFEIALGAERLGLVRIENPDTRNQRFTLQGLPSSPG